MSKSIFWVSDQITQIKFAQRRKIASGLKLWTSVLEFHIRLVIMDINTKAPYTGATIDSNQTALWHMVICNFAGCLC